MTRGWTRRSANGSHRAVRRPPARPAGGARRSTRAPRARRWPPPSPTPPGHVFNNAAIVAEELVRRTGERVAILDVDYHHGNGTQQLFYARGDVLYVSLHGDPDRAYPYFAGFAEETGVDAGERTNLNLPLPLGCSNEEYLANLDRGLEAIGGFGGSTLVVSLGIDTYGRDPICDLALTTDAYHEAGRRVAALERSTIVLQEGGYFVPHLGENVRNWLLGLEGREPDLSSLPEV